MSRWIPLIAESIWNSTPEEFRERIKGMERLPHKKVAKPYNIRINDKGTPVIRVNRNPQYLMRDEVLEMARDAKISETIILEKLKSRKIPVHDKINPKPKEK